MDLHYHELIDCWGLTTRQPFGSFCVVSQTKGEEIEEIVEEMKERDRKESGTGMKVKKQKKYKHPPQRLPLPATRIADLTQL